MSVHHGGSSTLQQSQPSFPVGPINRYVFGRKLSSAEKMRVVSSSNPGLIKG